MTIDEYINRDIPFYHVTPTVKLMKILTEGLRVGRNGICVVRSCEDRILNEIIRQINMDGYDSFAVIKILPSKHGVHAYEVCRDSVDEVTAPLQNYIVRTILPVDETDILFREYRPNWNIIVGEDEQFEDLDGYHLSPRPNIDVLENSDFYKDAEMECGVIE